MCHFLDFLRRFFSTSLLVHFEPIVSKTEWILMESEQIDAEEQLIFMNLLQRRNQKTFEEMVFVFTKRKGFHSDKDIKRTFARIIWTDT